MIAVPSIAKCSVDGPVPEISNPTFIDLSVSPGFGVIEMEVPEDPEVS